MRNKRHTYMTRSFPWVEEKHFVKYVWHNTCYSNFPLSLCLCFIIHSKGTLYREVNCIAKKKRICLHVLIRNSLNPLFTHIPTRIIWRNHRMRILLLFFHVRSWKLFLVRHQTFNKFLITVSAKISFKLSN